MKLSIISFTENGITLSEKIAEKLEETEFTLFTKCSTYLIRKNGQHILFIEKSLGQWAKEQMEKLYPSYRFIECRVFYSDILDGVYIKVLMRKKEADRWTGKGKSTRTK